MQVSEELASGRLAKMTLQEAIGVCAGCNDINDLDDNVVNNGNKLVDDTKNGGIVDCEEQYLMLQQDLDQSGR